MSGTAQLGELSFRIDQGFLDYEPGLFGTSGKQHGETVEINQIFLECSWVFQADENKRGAGPRSRVDFSDLS